MKVVLIMIAIALICGCTNKDWYNKAKQDQKNHCIKHATSPQDIERCEAQFEKWKSYEEYEKERKEIIDNN